MPRGQKTTFVIELDDATRTTLTVWLRSPRTTARLAKRVQGLLLLDQHVPYAETARLTGLSETHLRKWSYRFLAQGLDGLLAKRGERMLRSMPKPRPAEAIAFLRKISAIRELPNPERSRVQAT